MIVGKIQISSEYYDRCVPARLNWNIGLDRQWAEHVMSNELFYSPMAKKMASEVLRISTKRPPNELLTTLISNKQRKQQLYRILRGFRLI